MHPLSPVLLLVASAGLVLSSLDGSDLWSQVKGTCSKLSAVKVLEQEYAYYARTFGKRQLLFNHVDDPQHRGGIRKISEDISNLRYLFHEGKLLNSEVVLVVGPDNMESIPKQRIEDIMKRASLVYSRIDHGMARLKAHIKKFEEILLYREKGKNHIETIALSQVFFKNSEALFGELRGVSEAYKRHVGDTTASIPRDTDCLIRDLQEISKNDQTMPLDQVERSGFIKEQIDSLALEVANVQELAAEAESMITSEVIKKELDDSLEFTYQTGYVDSDDEEEEIPADVLVFRRISEDDVSNFETFKELLGKISTEACLEPTYRKVHLLLFRLLLELGHLSRIGSSREATHRGHLVTNPVLAHVNRRIQTPPGGNPLGASHAKDRKPVSHIRNSNWFSNTISDRRLVTALSLLALTVTAFVYYPSIAGLNQAPSHTRILTTHILAQSTTEQAIPIEDVAQGAKSKAGTRSYARYCSFAIFIGSLSILLGLCYRYSDARIPLL